MNPDPPIDLPPPARQGEPLTPPSALPGSQSAPVAGQAAPPAGQVPGQAAGQTPAQWQAPPVIALEPAKPIRKGLTIALIIVLLAGIGAGATWFIARQHRAAPKSASTTHAGSQPAAPTVTGLALNTSQSYGNKYASGLLPVGDGKYSADKVTKGFVYTCSSYTKNLTASEGQGGAGTRGPWFTNNNTQYDITKKSQVQGNVMWQASFTNSVSGSTRTIVTNDLPSHPTGIFPIATADPAYAYDRNPNTIKGQNFTYSLAASPQYGQPNCMGGEVGVTLTGVILFNAFDAGGRDAGAWEVQDACSGHPQKDGVYHYHTLSGCIKDTSVQTVIGYALDGFPITGPKVAANSILTTDDLDECHGLTSQIRLDGKLVTTYHYVMTQDFPYSVSCFRSKAINPPDQLASAGGGAQPASGGQQPPAGAPASSGSQSPDKQQPPQQ